MCSYATAISFKITSNPHEHQYYQLELELLNVYPHGSPPCCRKSGTKGSTSHDLSWHCSHSKAWKEVYGLHPASLWLVMFTKAMVRVEHLCPRALDTTARRALPLLARARGR